MFLKSSCNKVICLEYNPPTNISNITNNDNNYHICAKTMKTHRTPGFTISNMIEKYMPGLFLTLTELQHKLNEQFLRIYCGCLTISQKHIKTKSTNTKWSVHNFLNIWHGPKPLQALVDIAVYIFYIFIFCSSDFCPGEL